VLAVGEWTKEAPRGAVGRVSFSLTQSREITRLNGVAVDRVAGDDLRNIGAAYVQLPIVAGSYQVSVEARTAGGCAVGIDRPMTMVVTP
jgi:hypothetical protein